MDNPTYTDWQPTAKLRYHTDYSGGPFVPSIKTLQQEWVRTVQPAWGEAYTETEWRDVPGQGYGSRCGGPL